jgi:two-component system cell cycle response regulator PopA
MGRVFDVLMFGDSDRIETLGGELEGLGIRCRGIREDTPEPRISRNWSAGIILADTQDDVARGVAAIERFWTGHWPIIVISKTSLEKHDRIDSWLRLPAPAVQVAARIRALFRLYSMEKIAQRRAEVTALYGARGLPAERVETTPCVLYVGDASPRFMSLEYALRQADTDIVAAFSSYSAFDYLHERSFDAVVLNALDKQDTAFTISSAMRRNARLYHTPVLLLSDLAATGDAGEAFARGVSDILPADADEQEIQERILSLASERRRRREAKAALEACRDPRTLDVDTGLFNSSFVTSHVQDLLNSAALDNTSFAMLVLNVCVPDGADRPDDISAEKARRQFAAMLRHLLRTEDAAARIDEARFIAVLPNTDREGVENVATRVSAIAECTAFESDDPLRPFRLSVMATSVETQGEETAEALIERALRTLRSQDPYSAQA